MKPKTKNLKTKISAGFSLIELLVVIGIFSVLSGIVLSNYGQFNVRASLDNLTHLVAVSIRQAQVYGISVSRTQNEYRGYGVYFSTATQSDKSNFILFSDRLNSLGQSGSDKLYNGAMSTLCSGLDECLSKTRITTGDTVSEIWANRKTGSAISLRNIHIVFTRPNPDASLYGTNSSTGSLEGPFADIEILLTSSKGNSSKKVIVWSTGQVSVE